MNYEAWKETVNKKYLQDIENVLISRFYNPEEKIIRIEELLKSQKQIFTLENYELIREIDKSFN